MEDLRNTLPKGTTSWTFVHPRDRIGLCVHHSGGFTTTNVENIARYHTSKENHITPGVGLPTIAYPFCITDDARGAILATNPLCRTYAQGKSGEGYEGDENRALVPVLILGDFNSPGHEGRHGNPSDRQLQKFWFVVRWLQETFGFEDNALFGHFDFGKPSCPGKKIMNQLVYLREGASNIASVEEAQEVLKRWRPTSLPKYGIDGDLGGETKYWLSMFQKAHSLQRTGVLDPFTMLKMLKYTEEDHSQGRVRLAPEPNRKSSPCSSDPAPSTVPKPVAASTCNDPDVSLLCEEHGDELVNGKCPSCLAGTGS